MPPNLDADTYSPNSEQTPPTPPPKIQKQRAFPWFWLGTFVGTVFSAAGWGLLAWGWIFIQEDLSPLLSKTLTKSLERPVELGDVESVTPTSLSVGPSKLGASAEDSTTVSADRVTVKFDLIETLFTAKLGLDLIVEGADGYLEQDPEKGWLNVEVPEQKEQDRRFEVRLDDVRVRDSQLTLVPLPAKAGKPNPIFIDEVSAEVNLDDVTVAGEEARRTRFEVTGDPQKGGEIVLKGEVQPIEAVKATGADADLDATPNTDSLEDLETNVDGDARKVQYATNLAIQADKAPLADILNFTLSTIDLATDQVAVQSGRVSGTMDMKFRPKQPLDYSGVISLDDGAIAAKALPLPLKKLDGQTRFDGSKWTVDSLSGEYGDIAAIAEGLIDFNKGYNLALKTEDVSVKEFTNTTKLKLPVPTEGTFDAAAKVTGPINNPQVLGTATAVTALDVDKLTFTSASADFRLQGRQLFLSDIAATPSVGGALRGSGQVLIKQGSPFTFQVAARSVPGLAVANLYGVQPGFKLGLVSADATVVSNGSGVNTMINWDAPGAEYAGSGRIDIDGRAIAFSDTTLQLGGGTATGSGKLVNGSLAADVNLQNVQLNAFSEQLKGNVSGQFQLAGNTDNLTAEAITASGNIAFSDGLSAFAPQFASLDKPLSAQVSWNGEQIAIAQASTDRITASGTLTPTFDGRFSFKGLERVNLNVAARDYGLNEIPFVVIPSVFDLSGRANFVGSIVGNPSSPQISSNVQVTNLVVNRLPFNSLLSGTVDYSASSGLNLNLAGSTDNIALNVGPTAIRPAGANSATPNLNFDVGWRSAFAKGKTQGDLLAIEAGNFPLSALNFPPPGATDIGQLRGTLTTADLKVNLSNQTLMGDIAIDQLGLGYIGAGRLAGKVRYANSLATLTDGELTLNDNLYTLSGGLALDGPVPVYSANLETQQGNVQNILTALSIYRIEDLRRGLTAPDWIENPPSQSVLDSILATSPTGQTDAALVRQLRRLAEIQAIQAAENIAAASRPLPPLQKLSGPFAGKLKLEGSGSDFKLDFDLAGKNWEWGEAYSAQEVIAKGSLTPNILTLEPVRFASEIPVPADLEVVDTSANGSELIESPVAELSTAELEIAEANALDADRQAPSSGESLGMNSNGEQMGEAQTAIAFVNLAGQLVFGRNTELTSNLQATAQNLNIATLDKVLQLPTDIEGYANATATLGGTLSNPQMRGLAELSAATINDTPIQTADAQFLYQNARLSLTSKLTASTPDQPLTLAAQIPYAFNFMETQPQSDNIAVEINVEDEGLALLNIFTDQIAWESGSGQLNLKVGGTLRNPEIDGTATLDEAVINAKILPEPLTNVTGRATFAGEQIIVEGLQGQFSDGQLTAAGKLPLLYPIISGTKLTTLTSVATSEAADNPLFPQPLAANLPLTVNFENIDLDYRSLYEGGVNGQIVVGGSALLGGPQIGGQVILSQGRITLPNGNDSVNSLEDAAATTSGSSTSVPASAIASAPASGGITPVFRDLRLTLGKSIRVIQGTQLGFVADGTLVLNGSPDNLSPNGIIDLKSGSVNLFTTLFRLRGDNNTAEFTPETGLQNPYLNVSLRSTVQEINSSGAVAGTPYATAEIADTANNGFNNPGSLRTIRVRADVEGPANAILENIELSSSPARSESELVTLIGGGFITAAESIEQGNGLGGIVNLLGGTILTRVQDVIGNALSLSEFNLFPITAASNQSADGTERDSGGLGIAASVGFDLTDSTSLSITKILTDSSNPQIGANYRLTDALTVRGTTDFADVNQFLLEYELRF
ncbi:MAG: translocation/assembly module TamB domain-containing protein [Phormidesmis sp.]